MNQLNLKPEDKGVINATVIYNNIDREIKKRDLLISIGILLGGLFLFYLSAYSYHQWDSNWHRQMTCLLLAILGIILFFLGLGKCIENV